MMSKSTIKKIFPGLVMARNRFVNFVAHYRFKNWSTEKVFETIYNENHWNEIESKSCTGSNSKNTAQVVKIIEDVFNELAIKSVLDIPCGDFHWMRGVNRNGVEYLGGDIVQDLISKNASLFSGQSTKFLKMNILELTLPQADLILCRDCLVHFSYKDILPAIESIKKSNSKYLITTTFTSHKNYDIITGDWRPINLELPPFNLRPPILLYNEGFDEDIRFSDKSLAVWRISDI
jgi:hypothetical protein